MSPSPEENPQHRGNACIEEGVGWEHCRPLNFRSMGGYAGERSGLSEGVQGDDCALTAHESRKQLGSLAPAYPDQSRPTLTYLSRMGRSDFGQGSER